MVQLYNVELPEIENVENILGEITKKILKHIYSGKMFVPVITMEIARPELLQLYEINVDDNLLRNMGFEYASDLGIGTMAQRVGNGS